MNRLPPWLINCKQALNPLRYQTQPLLLVAGWSNQKIFSAVLRTTLIARLNLSEIWVEWKEGGARLDGCAVGVWMKSRLALYTTLECERVCEWVMPICILKVLWVVEKLEKRYTNTVKTVINTICNLVFWTHRRDLPVLSFFYYGCLNKTYATEWQVFETATHFLFT